MSKYVGSNALLYFSNKLKGLIDKKVDKVEGKVLSTNDLTDELKNKILAAGTSSFSGSYNDLTNKPDLTVLAKTADLPTKTSQLTNDSNFAATSDLPTKTSQLTNDSDFTTTGAMNTAISTATNGLAKTADVNTAIATATSGLASTDAMNTAISEATNGLATEEYVNTKITAVYRYKGSLANKEALPTADQVVGDTYNLEDTGMNVAWNGTDWDDLGSIIDLTGYVKETDLVEVTNAEIDGMFTA